MQINILYKKAHANASATVEQEGKKYSKMHKKPWEYLCADCFRRKWIFQNVFQARFFVCFYSVCVGVFAVWYSLNACLINSKSAILINLLIKTAITCMRVKTNRIKNPPRTHTLNRAQRFLFVVAKYRKVKWLLYDWRCCLLAIVVVIFHT